MKITRVPVLMYHHINFHEGDTVTVTPDVFRAQMEFLRDEGYGTISAEQLLAHIRGELTLSSRTVAITFDDGWLDNYVHAVPVLKELGFKGTFFLITDRVDAASGGNRPAAPDFPDHGSCKRLIRSGGAEKVVLDWDLVRELQAGGLFGFYSHTVTHRRCADLSQEELFVELALSKQRLESETGAACNFLCWPYGSFSKDSVAIAANIGYKGIFTTIDGFCEAYSSQDMIQRIEAMNSLEWLKDRLCEEKG